jgi:CheY-like chemotaxis protein
MPRRSGEWLEMAPVLLGFYALLGGLISFAGWAFGIPMLTHWDGGEISIQPNASLAAAITGAAVWLFASGRYAVASALGTLVALIGATVLVEYATGLDFGIDGLFLFGREWGQQGVLNPGRMGPPGAVSWTLIGLALAISGSQKGANKSTSPVTAALPVVAAGIATLSLIGRLYGASEFYAIPTATVIATQTSSFVLAVSIGLLLTYREHGLTRLLLDQGTAGTLVRRAIPAILFVPVGIGFMRAAGETAGLYDSSFGTAARTLIEIALLLGLLWWTARAISRQSHARQQAENRVRTNEARLRTIFDTVAVSLWELDFAASRSAVEELRARAITDVRQYAREHPEFVRAIRQIRVLDVNGTTVRMCGAASKSDLLGALPAVFGAEAEAVFADALAAIAAGRAYLGAEALLWPIEGAPIYAFMTMALPASEDEANRILLSVFDLTDRNRAEEARRQSETSRREADRRRSELIDTLAHELRNPLAALRTGADLLKRQPGLTGELEWAAEVIDRQTAVMARLLDELLKLDRPDGQAASPQAPASVAQPAAQPRLKKILVVDDNLDAASSLALLLGLSGHETHAAFDGQEAIEKAEALRPDVILLDLGLPKVNGYDVCRRIRGQAWGQGMTVIALTGWGQDADRAKTRDAGFDHHIVKPIEHSRLIELLAST